MIFNLKSQFPRASQDCVDLNPLSSPPREDKTRSTASVGTRNGIRRGRMNKTEESYSRVLDAMKARGEILSWDFQGMTLRWLCGDKAIKYTADFVVRYKTDSVMRDGHDFIVRIRLVEIKGGYSKIPGYLERAVERFRHAKTYWGEVFQMELHQKTKEGWKQLI